MHGGTRRSLPVERDGMVSDRALGKNGHLFRDAMVRASFVNLHLHVSPNHSFIEDLYERICFGRRTERQGHLRAAQALDSW